MRMKIKTMLLIFVMVDVCFLFSSSHVRFVHPVFAETKIQEGVNAENNFSTNCMPIIEADDLGSYDVAMGPDGYLYASVKDGRILKFTADGSNMETFLNTGGIPNGLEFDSKGNLMVADANKGILSISPDKKITVLTDSVNEEKFFCLYDLDIEANGTLWFTDSLENVPMYRLLSFNPDTKETKIVFENFSPLFGVTLGPDDAYVLANDLLKLQIVRFWLKGPNAGQQDTFISNLPSPPYIISFNGKDTFWLTLLGGGYRVIGIDTNGKIVHDYHDKEVNPQEITGANELNGRLYISNDQMISVGKIDLP